MDGFERRRQRKKTEILEASLELFMNYGVQKVSITEIATKANVSQVTIYNYFQSKDNLAHETIIYYVDKAWEEGLKILESDLSFPEKVKFLIFNKKQAADKIHEDFYLFMMKEYSGGLSYIEDFYQKRAIPRLIELFNEGRKEGFVDPEISNEAILFFIHMIKEYSQREDVYTKILPLTEDIMKLLFYGIAGKEKNEKRHTDLPD
ncbi:TetR/AcrR family transcriptional regulator [Evansella cellulosilytica]|uniref:Transcriptional regulator, TetR family n=1 Tax=Evansella cellulosilytica (strain ATCC 21833 / DSM 2522 / FERM P-1141 / JCM 9156 / N-4) TaxID=649639 RepID=E6TWB1_EVAC2|nr:TetR/AcrR family transcriptional regulator [Evansella cellulosilytica]ADU31067.1 transcriptional regulator, TetR family [Evansella cellulosilytica DSM 2522]